MRTLQGRKAAVLVLLVLACGCKRMAPSEEAVTRAEAPMPAQAAAPSAPARDGEAAAPALPRAQQVRKLIRTVDLALVVRDTEAVAREVHSLASSLGGFVSDVNAQRRAFEGRFLRGQGVSRRRENGQEAKNLRRPEPGALRPAGRSSPPGRRFRI